MLGNEKKSDLWWQKRSEKHIGELQTLVGKDRKVSGRDRSKKKGNTRGIDPKNKPRTKRPGEDMIVKSRRRERGTEEIGSYGW